MVKKLTKTGNDLALVFDRPLLEAARIDSDTPLEISTNGDVIVISPVRDGGRENVLRAGNQEINERYAGVFRRLATEKPPLDPA